LNLISIGETNQDDDNLSVHAVAIGSLQSDSSRFSDSRWQASPRAMSIAAGAESLI
jgi:hypothetical protein